MPMNDPHVKALHYYIQHDNSVAYNDVEPLVHDDALFRIRAEKRNVVLEPKCHYATEEEAKSAAEEFVRRWEFKAAPSRHSPARSGLCIREPTLSTATHPHCLRGL